MGLSTDGAASMIGRFQGGNQNSTNLPENL